MPGEAAVGAEGAGVGQREQGLKQDIFDFEAEHIEDYELPDYADIFVALQNLSK